MIRLLVAALLALLVGSSGARAQAPPTTQCVSTALAGGTADAITIPQLPCVPTTTLLMLTTSQANTTTTPTITVTGSPPQVVKRYDGTALHPGDFPVGGHTMLTNNGQNWFLMTVTQAAAGGTVTSVGLTEPAEFTVTGSPVTVSGTLAVAKANETANTVWAGPTTGSPAAPTFRALTAADVPSTTIICAALPAGGCPFDATMFMPGVPANSAIVRVAITRPVSCPVAFTGSAGIAKTAATGTTVVNVNQVTGGTGTLRGTLTWSAAGTVATPASSAGMTLAANDIVEFAFPGTADATLADVAITLKCART